MNSLAFDYFLAGRYAEAEKLQRETLAVARKMVADHWRIGYGQAVLGASCRSAEVRRSAALLLHGYEILHTKRGDREETRYAVNRLAALYDAWGKPDKAAEWRAKASAAASPSG